MKRTLIIIAVLLGAAAILSACMSPAATPEQPQPAATLAAQTNAKLMTLLAKQLTPLASSTAAPTFTQLPPTFTPTPSQTSSPAVPQTPGGATTMPTLTRTLSENCLSSFLVGIIGSKFDTEKHSWVLEEKSNEPFIVTFDVRNTGTCTWDPSFQLVYWSGEHMSGPDFVLLGSTIVPNDPKLDHAFIDVGPLMIGAKGYHDGYWSMKSSDGRTFGPTFWLNIHIGG